MALCSNNVYKNIPTFCESILHKLDTTTTAAMGLSFTPEEISVIKRNLFTEINELKLAIESDKEYLKLVTEDLNVCKEKTAKIEKWEEDFRRLDSVLPVVKKPANHTLNGIPKTYSAVQSNTTLEENGTKKNGIPMFSLVNEVEWNSTPSYLKLRYKLDQVNNFIKTLNQELIEKYTILKKKRSALSRSETALWVSYKATETADTKGLYFIVVSDLKKAGVSEKTISSMSSILRHCRKLRELRSGKLIRFIVVH